MFSVHCSALIVRPNGVSFHDNNSNLFIFPLTLPFCFWLPFPPSYYYGTNSKRRKFLHKIPLSFCLKPFSRYQFHKRNKLLSIFFLFIFGFFHLNTKDSRPKMPTSKIAQSRDCVKQLQYEINKHETMQPNALSAVRFHRFDFVSFRFIYFFFLLFLWLLCRDEKELLWLCLSCPLLSKRRRKKVELKTRAPMLDALCAIRCVWMKFCFYRKSLYLYQLGNAMNISSCLCYLYSNRDFGLHFLILFCKKKKKLTSINDNQLILFHSRTRFAFQLNNTLITMKIGTIRHLIWISLK